jgi:Tfp pilus assembly protein PilX
MGRRHPPASAQRGVVLFVALIAMVVLSLGGIALIRSMDTGTSVISNLAYRTASIAPMNAAVEAAVDAVFKNPTIGNLDADDLPHNYYASLQAGEKANALPAVLYGNPPAAYPGAFQTIGPDAAGNTVRYAIERVCSAAGAATVATCDMLPPKLSNAKTSMKLVGPVVPPLPYYRVSVRVDGPGNTVTFAQAMMR